MSVATHDEDFQARKRKTTKVLLLIILGMFSFGWLAVPFYGMLCRHFGIGPVSARPAAAGIMHDPLNRSVDVRFMAQVNAGLAADFGPVKPHVQVKVGEPTSLKWHFRNLSDKPIEFQAIYSVAPDHAAPALEKIECFCFTRQSLKPHESRIMPVTVRVNPEKLPKGVHEITLGYTLFAIKPDEAAIHSGQAKSLADIHHDGH